MGWIKRNLFFVAGGALALVLLGGAVFFIWHGWSLNSEASTQLNEIYGKLQQLAQAPLQPGNEKNDNTKLAREQEKELRNWIASSAKYFKPIPPIPTGTPVSSSAYAEGLRQTIDFLQHAADSASVTLPPKYDFSFSAQRSLVRFAPGSLDLLAVQLGEVKVISEILFAERVTALDSIQRVRVSDDDLAGLQSDYVEQHPITNELAIITPYVVTFRCFTPELARVVSGFATSPNPFLVKTISVQPATGAATPADQNAAFPNPYNPYGRYGPGGPVGAERGYRGEGAMPGMTPYPGQQPTLSGTGRGGLQTVLKEQLLRITMEVETLKLLPKS
jgi:hypothetical protein